MVASDTLSVISSGNDATYAADAAVIALQGKNVTLESKAGGNGIKVTSGGTVNVDGADVTIKAGERGAIATSVGGTVSVIATNKLTIEATIDNNKTANDNIRYSNAVAVVGGQVTLEAPTLSIKVNNPDNKDFVNAIAIEGGALNLNSKNATVDGTVSNKGELNLKGVTVFNNKVTNEGTITIGQGVTFFKGGLQSGNMTRALFASRATTGVIELDGGTLVLEGTENNISTLTGEGSLQLNTLSFNIGNNEVAALGVTVGKEISEAAGENYEPVVNQVLGQIGGNNISVLTLEEGDTTDRIVLTFDDQGNVTGRTVTANTTMTDMLEMGAATANAVTRTLQNDVRKRLGDLRSAEAQSGAWVRYDGGRMSGQHTATKFNTLQMGYDTVAFRDDVRVGASLSYTRGDTELRRGSADVDTYSFAMYGTWMADNGMFADVIARVASVKNDMTFAGDKTGKLDNTAYAISGEFGQRFDVAKNFFVEPQIEVSYTYIDSDDVRLTGVSSAYKFDSVESLIGRAGMVAGWTCPNQKGHVYARASVLREFMGDSEVSAGSNRIERDGQDTWAEIGLGAQYNINKNAYVWADVERTQGADINEDFRGTVGVRFNF